jgi:dihydropteroate synthase
LALLERGLSIKFQALFDSKERIGGTLASVLYTLMQGVQIFRVHNVNEVKQGILVFKKIVSY